MIQGTGSHVGKSVITAALCRIFKEDGINVAPFKSQNMALNSFVTAEGGEMGRAQVVQAEAAGLEPHVDMNPILLKPHTDQGAQVIIHGKVYGNLSARDFHGFKEEAHKFVKESYDRLSNGHELIVIEGAGSPAEINLRENDIANMGTAHLVDAPVILVGDIDRGGVFASLVGTLELLDEADRKRIKGFLINKFRGDISLLKSGLDFLEKKTGLPVLGVLPWFRDIYIEEEDGVNLECGWNVAESEEGVLRIAVLHLPHISNFTDFDPFIGENDVVLRYVKRGERIGLADLVIIPGSKSTISDLCWLKETGYMDEIQSHLERGGALIGICGGYQMLGQRVSDPQVVETGGQVEGLGLLDIETELTGEKVTRQVEARPLSGPPQNEEALLQGYEIHMGRTDYLDGAKPIFEVKQRDGGGVIIRDGAQSADGRIWGTYLHGIFENDDFRRKLLNQLRSEIGAKVESQDILNRQGFKERKEEGFSRLAEIVRENVDMEKINKIAGLA